MSNDIVPESQPTSVTPESTSEQTASPASDPAPVGSASIAAEPSEPDVLPTAEPVAEAPAEEPAEPQENFADILSQFEKSHTHKPASGVKQIEGTIVSLSAEQVFVDIGYKTEGVLPRSAFPNNGENA